MYMVDEVVVGTDVAEVLVVVLINTGVWVVVPVLEYVWF